MAIANTQQGHVCLIAFPNPGCQVFAPVQPVGAHVPGAADHHRVRAVRRRQGLVLVNSPGVDIHLQSLKGAFEPGVLIAKALLNIRRRGAGLKKMYVHHACPRSKPQVAMPRPSISKEPTTWMAMPPKAQI